MAKRKMNKNSRREIEAYQSAQRRSKSGSIVAVVHSNEFLNYSVRNLYHTTDSPEEQICLTGKAKTKAKLC